MAELPLSSQVGPQVWRTVASEHIPIAQKSMWLFVVCSPLSDALLLSVIVLDCVGLQDVGGRLSWACLGERFCGLVQIVRPAPVSSTLSVSAICDLAVLICRLAATNCWKTCHIAFPFLSSSRLQAVVAVVLFLQGVAHWMEHFLTADETTHFVVFFRTCILTCAVHEHQNGSFFVENKLVPFHMALRNAFRKTRFAIRTVQHKKLHVRVACLRFFPRQDTMARRSVVIFMGTH